MGAGGLASRMKELSSMTAERNHFRSEAAGAGRQADQLTQRMNAMPKARTRPLSLFTAVNTGRWAGQMTQHLTAMPEVRTFPVW